ncbi:MAG: hypothetical protein RLO51_24540 [Thalassobaculum sp.]|uniref:hypothetical protein n=1 Tax=Thalassobaculum sp. TaxID=2022740 RepID=UPI0032EBEB81
MARRWWHATPTGRRRVPDVRDPIASAAFRNHCWAGAILIAEAEDEPTRVFLDPVVQAGRRRWRAALGASLTGEDFPAVLHLLCTADWHLRPVESPEELSAATAAWVGLADGAAWATIRIACRAAPGIRDGETGACGAMAANDTAGPTDTIRVPATVREGIAPLASGRYRTAATLLVAAQRRIGAREAMLVTPGGDDEGTVTRLDHHLQDGFGPPRIDLTEVMDWVIEADRSGTAIVAHDALARAETSTLLAVIPTSTLDAAGAAIAAVAVLRIPPRRTAAAVECSADGA